MSTVGPVSVFDATIASGATFSSEIDLRGSYGRVSLIVPTMASKTTAFVEVSDQSGGTFYDAHYEPTSATPPVPVQVSTDIVSGAVMPIPVNAQFLKVKVNSAPTLATAFKIICSSN